MDNVSYLPVWKKGATAEERFLELAMMARQNPDRFSKVAVIWSYENEEKAMMATRYVSSDMTTMELLGLLELGRQEVFSFLSTGTGD